MEPEAQEAPKTKKRAAKGKGKAAGKKPEVTEADDGGDEMEVIAEQAPKVKKKATKPTVREVINDNCGEPAGRKQVSFNV